MSKTIKTNGVTDSINNQNQLGDQLNNMFQQSKDLKVVYLAMACYKGAVSAGKELIKYKKLTGSPDSIEFFEN
jgi:hypothetical protein